MKRKFDVKLRKVGNSFVVTIPVELVERFDVNEGDFLAVELDSKEIQKSSLKKTSEKGMKEKRGKEKNEK